MRASMTHHRSPRPDSRLEKGRDPQVEGDRYTIRVGTVGSLPTPQRDEASAAGEADGHVPSPLGLRDLRVIDCQRVLTPQPTAFEFLRPSQAAALGNRSEKRRWPESTGYRGL